MTERTDQEGHQCQRRISKESVFMVLAMWMEQSPLAEPTQRKKKVETGSAEAAQTDNIVGAVLVTEENRLYAMDCTREGVHAMARLLMKHSQKLKNSTVYTSRRPCSFCAKLLVQCGVRRLYYLPTEPESSDDEDLKRVDNLLKVAPLAHSYLVPNVGEKYKKTTEDEKSTTEARDDRMETLKETLMKNHWSKKSMEEAAKKLYLTAWNEKMLNEFEKDFKEIIQWIAEVTVRPGQDDKFVNYCNEEEKMDPEKQVFFKHSLAVAKILAKRTDDPTKGVGSVIILKDKEIVATGWNGFPSKALYGQFPRAADKKTPSGKKETTSEGTRASKKAETPSAEMTVSPDEEATTQETKDIEDLKYSYIIHAEQNALLMRNAEDISESTLVVTKVPCDECFPLLKLQNVHHYVIGETREKVEVTFKIKNRYLSYDMFRDHVEKHNECCHVLTNT